MNLKLSKLSNEELNKKLVKMEKYQKILKWVVIGTIILTILSFLLEGKIDTYLGGPLSILILALITKYVIYPTQIGTIKTEINRRKEI